MIQIFFAFLKDWKANSVTKAPLKSSGDLEAKHNDNCKKVCVFSLGIHWLPFGSGKSFFVTYVCGKGNRNVPSTSLRAKPVKPFYSVKALIPWAIHQLVICGFFRSMKFYNVTISLKPLFALYLHSTICFSTFYMTKFESFYRIWLPTIWE